MGGEIQPILWSGKGPGIQEASGPWDHSLPFSCVANLKLFWARERVSCEDGRGDQDPEELPGYVHLSREDTGQSEGQVGLMEPVHFRT